MANDKLKEGLEDMGLSKEQIEEILALNKKVTKEHEKQVDLGKRILETFKSVNGLAGIQAASLSTIRQFNKEILGDAEARKAVYEAQDKAIQNAETDLIEARLSQFEVGEETRAQVLAEIENRKHLADMFANQAEDARAAMNASYAASVAAAAESKKALDESNKAMNDRYALEVNLATLQARMSTITGNDEESIRLRAQLTGEIASASSGVVALRQLEIDKMKEANQHTENQNKYFDQAKGYAAQMNDILGHRNRVLQEITELEENLPRIIAEAVEQARLNALEAERRLKAEQALKKELVRSAGYMAYMEDSSYSMLGPAAETVKTFKELSKTIKVVPIPFLILSQLLKLGIDRFIALDKAAEEFRKETGFTNTQMETLRKQAEEVNKEFVGMGVSIEKVYKAASALTDVFGRTTLVSKDMLQNVSLLSVNLGVAEADSAEVLSIFQGLGGATEQVAMNTIKAGAALSEKTGVPFAKVMKDIAGASSTTAILLGANPSKLMKAAIAARALGTDLNTLANQQKALLNYSDSINHELEASAMLGKSISFQEARRLAYEGKIEESAKATLDMVKQAGDFNEMSVYQRESLARAAGMELKDLTKMMAVEKQREDIMLRGTPEQKAKLKAQEAELKLLKERNKLDEDDLIKQGEREIRQQKMQGLMTQLNNVMEELKTAAADILEPLITPLVKVLVPILKVVVGLIKIVLYPFKALADILVLIGEKSAAWAKEIEWVKDLTKWISDATTAVSKFYKENKTMIDSIAAVVGAGLLGKWFFGTDGPSKLMDMIKAPFNMVKDLGTGLMSKVTGKGAGAAADMIGPKLPDAAKGTTDATKGISEAAKTTQKTPSGTGVKDFLTNLAAGLKEMGNARVVFGALNLIPASIGLIAMIPGFLGAKLLEVINGPALAASLLGIATGLTAMGTGGVAKGALVMLLASAGFAGMTLGAIGLGAVALFGAAAGAGLAGLAAGLMVLSGAGIGVLVLLGVSAAFIGLAYAGKLAAEAFVMIAKALPETIGPIIKFALVSPLLYVAAGGIGVLAASLGVLALASGASLIASVGIFIIAKAIEKLGTGIGNAATGMASFAKNASGTINTLRQLGSLSLSNPAKSIQAIADALSSFGTGSAIAGIGSFVGNFLGGDPIAKMERLSGISDKLENAANAMRSISNAVKGFGSIDSFAKSISGLTDAFSKIGEDSISKISKFSSMADKLKESAVAIGNITTSASQFEMVDKFAKSIDTLSESLNKLNDSLGKIKSEELSKLTAVSNRSTNTATEQGAQGAPGMNTSGIEAKLDKLTELLVGGAVRVYLNGKDVSSGLANSVGR